MSVVGGLGSSLGPEISQSFHGPWAMRNPDLAKCQLGTKPPGRTQRYLRSVDLSQRDVRESFENRWQEQARITARRKFRFFDSLIGSLGPHQERAERPAPE